VIDMTRGQPTNKTEALRHAKSVRLTRVIRVIRAVKTHAHATLPSSRATKTSNSIRSQTGKRSRRQIFEIATRVTTARPISSSRGATLHRSNGAAPRHLKGSFSPATRLLRNTKHAAATRVLVTMMTTTSVMTTTAHPWPNPAACVCPSA
jgi:hypothetical protein